MLPTYLFNSWGEIRSSILSSKHLCILLDFDGTLAPIMKRPDVVQLPPATKETLRELSDGKRCFIGVVSGRALSDVKNRVGLNGIFYAGNHGLEIEGPNIKFTPPVNADILYALQEVRDSLQSILGEIEGVFIEDKGLTLSVHYRLLPEDKVEWVFQRIYGAAEQWDCLTFSQGDKIIEVRPAVDWNKGNAAEFIIRTVNCNALPIFIGDDVTDEDAFRKMKNGLAVAVMCKPRQTSAKYYLRNPLEVNTLLRKITEII